MENTAPKKTQTEHLYDIYASVVKTDETPQELKKRSAAELIAIVDLTLRGEYLELVKCLNALASMKGTLEAKRHITSSKDSAEKTITLCKNADRILEEKQAEIADIFRAHAELRRIADALAEPPPPKLLRETPEP